MSLFKFKFSADGSEFTRGLNKMKGEVKSFAKSAGGMMAGAFIGAKMIQGIRKIGDELDRVGKLAQRFDTSAASIQKLGHAAELNGANFERLAKGMTDANRMAEESIGGNQRAADAFDAMGISAEAFLGMGLEEQVAAMADGFLIAEEKAMGFEAATALLGGSSKELIPLLRQGSAAIKEQGESAGIASEKLIRQTQAFNDAVTKMKSAIFGFFAGIVDKVQKVVPIFVLFKDIFQNSVTFALQSATAVAGSLWETLKKIGSGDFSGGINSLADGADRIMNSFKNLGDSNAASVDKAFDALNSADIKERTENKVTADQRQERKKDKGKAAIARGNKDKEINESKEEDKARAARLKKAEADAKAGQGNLKSLKGSSVSSGIISTSLRSIGGGGNATVTRDPSLQIAKRQEKILEQIAKNTQHAADVEKNQPTQTEF